MHVPYIVVIMFFSSRNRWMDNGTCIAMSVMFLFCTQKLYGLLYNTICMISCWWIICKSKLIKPMFYTDVLFFLSQSTTWNYREKHNSRNQGEYPKTRERTFTIRLAPETKGEGISHTYLPPNENHHRQNVCSGLSIKNINNQMTYSFEDMTSFELKWQMNA